MGVRERVNEWVGSKRRLTLESASALTREEKVNVLVIPDPDEWVQTRSPPYVVSLRYWNSEKFRLVVLPKNMSGKDIREWLRMNGTHLSRDVPLSEIDYVVCSCPLEAEG